MKVMINDQPYVSVALLERALAAHGEALQAYRQLCVETNGWSIPEGLTERQKENIRASLNGFERQADRSEKVAEKLRRDIAALNEQASA